MATSPDALSQGQPHILVVDDDRRLRELLTRYLSENGFRVTSAEDAQAARTRLRSFEVDLIILDVMMPGESGLSLAQSLRNDSRVPILMLTARNESADRISGLESGADDYLGKPFEPRELVLRIRTILARVNAPPPSATVETVSSVRFGPFAFDLERVELIRDGVPVRLTTGESSLLAALARRSGAPVTREALRAEASECANTRAVDVQVARLRRKIERDARDPLYLLTVRGKGYALRID
ncbi:MAG TPA: response regulator [Alphaproteobacteria bacterium]|jgi:two-component system phosphate regulon response regulator OmpR|nr:response regulator [Alphaproteobacteria bacterium]